MTSLYIHIPFCKQKCYYCDFLSFTNYNKSFIDLYITYLIKELSFYKNRIFSTIYIGGGTPSILSAQQLEKLLSSIGTIFPLHKVVEYTIEVNPESLQEDFLKAMIAHGINRVSLGVQSFSDRVLQKINRPTQKKDIIRALHLVEKYDIANYNIDLIMGIQGSTIFKKDLSYAVQYQPSHISVYMLHVSPDSFLSALIERRQFTVWADKTYEIWYLFTVDFLGNAGYMQYEISNFAMNGYESVHNCTYWKQGEWIGVGIGAVSSIGPLRRFNVRDMKLYVDRLDADSLPVKEEEYLDVKKLCKEWIMLSLRMKKGISVNALKQCVQRKNIKQLNELIHILIDEQYGRVERKYLYLSPRGMIRFNDIVSEMFLFVD